MHHQRPTILLVLLGFGALLAAPSTALSAVDRGPEAVRAALGHRARVVWSPAHDRPTAVLGLDVPAPGRTPAERARRFLRDKATALRVEGATFRAGEVTTSRRQVVIRLQQLHEGVPVYQRGAVVTMDAAAERVRGVQLDVAPITLTETRDIGPNAAVTSVRVSLATHIATPDELPVEALVLAGPPSRRVYRVVVPAFVPFGRVSVFVDAATGNLVWGRHDAIRD